MYESRFITAEMVCASNPPGIIQDISVHLLRKAGKLVRTERTSR